MDDEPASDGARQGGETAFARTLKLQQLRIIAGLDELGLVSRVAEALNVTQPSVSKQIAEIERALDAPLVARERNRLFLTPMGKRLAFHAQTVLNQLRRAEFDIEAMRKGLSGSVRIGAVTSLSPIVLPGAIAMFKQTAPSASVAVREGHFVTLLPQLLNGGLDMVLARTWRPQEIDGVVQIPLMREPLAVCAGRDHPLGKHSDPSWSDALSHPWIMPEANSVARGAIDAFFAGRGLTPPGDVIESLSLPLNMELLRLTRSLCLLPERLALAHAARGEIVVLPLKMDDVLSEARCFHLEGQREANSTMDLLLQCLLRECGVA